MNEYGMRDSEGHERSALQFSQQSAITSDGLRSTECPILNLDAFLSPNLEPSREFECRRRSAVYYLEQYLGSLDRISHTCADFDTGATEALSNQSHSRTQRDMVRLKICTDTALRDLNVMESILLCTQENQKVQPQSLSPTAAFCTCTLCISAIVIPLKAAAVASGLGAFVGAMALTLPPIWQSLQCYNVSCVLWKVQDLKRAFAEATIDEKNRHALDSTQFSKVEGSISKHCQGISQG